MGLLIIDGIRDLMYDINSPSESTDLINLLMRWSSGYNLHIHTVLHLNKGDDNTRGHIGTEPVSYTHLDVYKRQLDEFIRCQVKFFFDIESTSVLFQVTADTDNAIDLLSAHQVRNFLIKRLRQRSRLQDV